MKRVICSITIESNPVFFEIDSDDVEDVLSKGAKVVEKSPSLNYKYLVFGGPMFYPSPGLKNLILRCNSLDELKNNLKYLADPLFNSIEGSYGSRLQWIQVLENPSGEIVFFLDHWNTSGVHEDEEFQNFISSR
tara:strand:- start:32437 stop:32838 length:402 start_codon:yes stop_codon:yes gene_type:complete